MPRLKHNHQFDYITLVIYIFILLILYYSYSPLVRLYKPENNKIIVGRVRHTANNLTAMFVTLALVKCTYILERTVSADLPT